MKQLFLLLPIFVLASVIVYGQDSIHHSCQFDLIEQGNPQLNSETSSSCKARIKFAPDDPRFTPIRNIRLIFHVFQREGENPRNFSESDQYFIDQILARVNQIYSGLDPHDPIPTCASQYIPDTRIRFFKDAIYYYQDNDAWAAGDFYSGYNGSDVFPEFVETNPDISTEKLERSIHILCFGCYTGDEGQEVCYSGGFAYLGTNWVSTNGYWSELVEDGEEYETGNHLGWNLAHELGHSLQLYHTFGDGASFCTPNTPSISNNVMDYPDNNDFQELSFTEQQLGQMNRYLEGQGAIRSSLKANVTDYCNKTIDAVVIESGESIVWDHNKKLTSDIIIESGGELIVRCKLGLPTDANIHVHRGARLFVDGGAITHNKNMWFACDEGKWGRIIVYGNNNKDHTLAMRNPNYTPAADDPGIVLLQNGLIEDAGNGAISMEGQDIPWPQVQDYWGGLVYAEGTVFLNNRRSATFMKYDKTNMSAFVNCEFLNEDGFSNVGITNWATQGVIVENCLFNEINDFGVLAIDGSFEVTYSTFQGINHAIDADGTLPLSGTMQVGLPFQGNTFLNNRIGVYSDGINRLSVSDNVFDGNIYGAVYNGPAESTVEYNTFDNGSMGLYLLQSASKTSFMNEADCNTYGPNTAGIVALGDNSNFTFSGESFNGTFWDVYLREVTVSGIPVEAGAIDYFQGDLSQPAGNLFSPKSAPGVSSIFTEGITNEFYYFYNDENGSEPRLRPDCALNNPSCGTTPYHFYEWEVFNFDNPDCPAGVTEFEEPTDEDRILDALPFPCEDLTSCLTAVEGEISQLQLQLDANPQDGDLIRALDQADLERNTIIREMVEQQIAAGQWPAADLLLSGETATEFQRMRFALAVLQEDYTTANTLLQNLPETAADDQHFKAIQEINLKRLQEGPEYILTANEVSTLEQAISAKTPSATYARALLILKEGRLYEPEFTPDGQVQSNAANEDKSPAFAQALQISPNPAVNKVQLTISGNADLSYEVIITDLMGRVQGQMVLGVGIHQLSTNDWAPGMYVVQLLQEDQRISEQKLLIQR